MATEDEVYLNEFNLNLNNVNEFNEYYKDSVIYLNNADELYDSYSSKKNDLSERKKHIHGEIDLNDRISYYQNQSQESLSFWYSIFWYIYYLLVIVLILGIIFDKSGRSKIKKIFIGFVAFLFPFLIKFYQTVKHYMYEKYLKKIIG